MTKVIFVVDTSGSNSSNPGTDPTKAYRIGSIDSFFNLYSGKSNFSWGLMSFNTTPIDWVASLPSTNSFVGPSSMLKAIAGLNASDMGKGYTNYIPALKMVTSAIIADPDNTPGNISAGLKYYVVFMSDGEPTDGNGTYTTYKTPVSNLLAAAPGAVTLDTVLYGNQSQLSSASAQAMLAGVALLGGGIGYTYLNTNSININSIVQQHVCQP
jgi:hypothetical protein